MSGLRLVVHGASGRMGKALLAEAAHEGLQVVAALDRGSPAPPAFDVLVDFSSPDGLASAVALALAQRAGLVVGTTGLERSHHGLLAEAAQAIPIVVAPNTSVGVAVLAHVTRLIAERLPDFAAELVEMHHDQKADAPSGTALRLADAVLSARGLDRSALRTGREGRPGPRTRDEVGVFAMRGGDVIGDHTVVFAGRGERLELAHKATDRGLFARGALRAVRWVRGRAAGLYAMEDVLGLR